MKKILIIQSYKDVANAEEERREYLQVLGSHAEITFASSIDDSLSWNTPAIIVTGYDGIIFGGSSDFDFDGGRVPNDPVLAESRAILERLRPLIAYLLEKDIPCLGICFGHQLIALAQGGSVQDDLTQNKIGTFAVTLTEAGKRDTFFGLLPPTFMAQYDHKDSVVLLPQGAVVLGVGERCRNSVLRYGGRCYTMQFHVEFSDVEMRAEYRSSSERFPSDRPIDEILRPSPEASTILPLFVERVC